MLYNLKTSSIQFDSLYRNDLYTCCLSSNGVYFQLFMAVRFYDATIDMWLLVFSELVYINMRLSVCVYIVFLLFEALMED